MNVRKVDAAEAAGWSKGKATGNKGARAANRAVYDALLKDFSVGDGAEFSIEAGEKKITVKNNIVKAAERRKMAVKFLRGKADTLKVRFEDMPATADVAIAETAPTE